MNYQSLIQLITSKTTLVKKVTPFLLSVSVFSLIFSNPSCHAFLFRFFKFYFSSLPMQFVNHAVDKTWIFLICNGILVVIANTSGKDSPSGFDPHDMLQKKIDDGLQALPNIKDNSLELSVSDNAVPELEGTEEKENDATEEEEEDDSCLILDDDEEEQEQESEFFVTEGEEGREETQELQISCITGDEENEEDSKTCFMMEEEDQEQLYDDEEEGIDKLSTEELNKKFDDFIRKMKEELRIEAQQQQQLVLVK